MGCPFKYDTCHRETEAKCPTKHSDGESLCTLGYTSIPRQRGEAFVAYEVRSNSGSDVVGIRLSATHRKMIRMLAERGGESFWDWSQTDPDMREPIKLHLQDLIKNGVMDEIPLVGSDRVVFRLTDYGRNLATQIIKEGATAKVDVVQVKG